MQGHTQAGRRDGDAQHSQKQAAGCTLANQGDVYRLITGDPGLVRGSTHRLTRDMTDQGQTGQAKTHTP